MPCSVHEIFVVEFVDFCFSERDFVGEFVVCAVFVADEDDAFWVCEVDEVGKFGCANFECTLRECDVELFVGFVCRDEDDWLASADLYEFTEESSLDVVSRDDNRVDFFILIRELKSFCCRVEDGDDGDEGDENSFVSHDFPY